MEGRFTLIDEIDAVIFKGDLTIKLTNSNLQTGQSS
jgi:hypothetical protein